ncbi:hypothetical protein GS429_16120 [Natronorubrum sp. JWXQ-INN-674]|uniref:Uncharacterized protein n=1 Tax=Natronorubrum halalkaliphilum TaxID=2691917 RepID=A0A6B0VQ05_9EURY|nr:hypothetical protein [Natronorubrum halalkaliphilum]MXV63554.1 hypothetical protein [Natronorubrum halalkaliphilum]
MEFAVSRDGTALVTLQGGSDTTACDDATADFTSTLESLEADGTVVDWTIDEAEIYEHPSGPFDPYTIAVEFAVTVIVDAGDADEAAEVGADTIDDTLERADIDAVSYTSAPAASAA